MTNFPVQFLDYRPLIKHILKTQGIKASEISKFIGLQPSQFSRAINGEFHLKTDHVFLICQFLDLKEDEAEYIELLAEINQSSLSSRVTHLKKRLALLQSKMNNTKKMVQADSISKASDLEKEARIRYYTNPKYMILHMFLMTAYSKDDLAGFLTQMGLDEVDFKLMINDLEVLGVVEPSQSDPSRFEVKKDRVHLDKFSSLQNAYTSAIRLKSLERITKVPVEKKQSLSVTMAISEESFPLIQQKINQLITDIGKICGESNAEKIYQFNLDYFPWLDK